MELCRLENHSCAHGVAIEVDSLENCVASDHRLRDVGKLWPAAVHINPLPTALLEKNVPSVVFWSVPAFRRKYHEYLK